MRRARRRRSLQSGDPQSYLVSVSDLMAGLLFLFIITVAVFAIRLKEQERLAKEREQQADHDLKRLRQAEEARRHLLEAVQTRLESRGVRVQIDKEQGTIRLAENAITFERNGWDKYLGDGSRNVGILKDVLGEVLPCYARDNRCPPSIENPANATLEAVFIEGHTDCQGNPHDPNFNWYLSNRRAVTVYNDLRLTAVEAPALDSLTNSSGNRLLSVSGYADSRPLPGFACPDADGNQDVQQNRRIELRFIMEPPSSSTMQVAPAAETEQRMKKRGGVHE